LLFSSFTLYLSHVLDLLTVATPLPHPHHCHREDNPQLRQFLTLFPVLSPRAISFVLDISSRWCLCQQFQ
jgi:hypothetical protein